MKFCSECGSKIETETQKFCMSCGTNLRPTINNNSPAREKEYHNPTIIADVSHRSLLEQELIYKQRRKKFWVALLLNALWAGAGNFYAGASQGAGICVLTFFGWWLSFLGIGVFIVFGLFIISSIMCYNKIEIENQKLKIEISKDKLTY